MISKIDIASARGLSSRLFVVLILTTVLQTGYAELNIEVPPEDPSVPVNDADAGLQNESSPSQNIPDIATNPPTEVETDFPDTEPADPANYDVQSNISTPSENSELQNPPAAPVTDPINPAPNDIPDNNLLSTYSPLEINSPTSGTTEPSTFFKSWTKHILAAKYMGALAITYILICFIMAIKGDRPIFVR